MLINTYTSSFENSSLPVSVYPLISTEDDLCISNRLKALFISDRGNRMFLADIDKIVKNLAVKTGTCKDSNRTDEKITPHFFRAWITYQLQINGCNPIVIDAIRGDKASNMRTFYAN